MVAEKEPAESSLATRTHSQILDIDSGKVPFNNAKPFMTLFVMKQFDAHF